MDVCGTSERRPQECASQRQACGTAQKFPPITRELPGHIARNWSVLGHVS
jgi:hypothetical protein